MLGGGLGAGAPRGHPGRVGARVWGWVAPGIPSLWELCPCRHSPRHPSSRPGGTCGSGQGAAGQASQRCAEAPLLPHLLRGPPRPLCLTLALFSLHGHLSLPGECSRRFCRLPAGTSPPDGRRACGCQSTRVRVVSGRRAKPSPPPDFSSKAPECLRIPCSSLACSENVYFLK